MKIYSYRPPRIRPADIDPHPVKKNSRALFIPLFVLLGILFGFHFIPSPKLISAVVSDGISSSSESAVLDAATPARAESPLTQLRPFLKGSVGEWKIQSSTPQQAIGGGPGLLKEALNVKAAISINYDTGEEYYAHNSTTRLRIASLTKIMTAMTAIDLVNLEEKFTVEQAATEVEPTVVGVRVGEELTTRELIRAGLLTSGNDAMAVLAQGIGKKYGGDTSLFVAAMNEKAKLIGLHNTQFANPQGYDDPNHYSTAEDLIYMTRYALQNYPEISQIVDNKEASLPATSTHHAFHLPNWNMLIGTYPGANGVKIGNTGEAGHTTAASATRNGKRVLVVVLGADGILKRDLSAAELLNVGFARLGISPFPMTEELLRTRINEWY